MCSVHDRPCAASGLTSYRYMGRWSWIMIGARDHEDALREAERSMYFGDRAVMELLYVWSAERDEYIPVRES